MKPLPTDILMLATGRMPWSLYISNKSMITDLSLKVMSNEELKKYDVTEPNKEGESGDLFDCGSDMTSLYSSKCGDDEREDSENVKDR